MIDINDTYSVDPAAVKEVYISEYAPWNVLLGVQVANERREVIACRCATFDEAKQYQSEITAEINEALGIE